jgi:hypothetical protein
MLMLTPERRRPAFTVPSGNVKRASHGTGMNRQQDANETSQRVTMRRKSQVVDRGHKFHGLDSRGARPSAGIRECL